MADRALALLWYAGRLDPRQGLAIQETVSEIESLGYGAQNVQRLKRSIRSRRCTAIAKDGKWRLLPSARSRLNTTYENIQPNVRPVPPPDTLLPSTLFKARVYLARVAEQVNGSYAVGYFDGCAVMGRRLVETLIIEVYEKQARQGEIQAKNGDYLMLGDMIDVVLADKQLYLSRDTKKGLREVKKAGDRSAHNRRFLAHDSDIEKMELRVVTEDLLHLADLVSPT